VETEPDRAEERARERLIRKSLDMIALNVIGEAGVGFGTDTNRVTLFLADGAQEALPIAEKREVARRMWEHITTALMAAKA
jgi:phosphopantothenoylcysteine decarboxylase/phosphopantothenate--cysteine ligase